MHSAHNIMYKFKLAQPVSLGLHSPALYPLHTVHVWSCFSTQAACVSGLGFPLYPQDPFPITLGTFFKNVEPLTHLIRMPTCPRCYTFTHLSTGVCSSTVLACGADGEWEAHIAFNKIQNPRYEASHPDDENQKSQSGRRKSSVRRTKSQFGCTNGR